MLLMQHGQTSRNKTCLPYAETLGESSIAYNLHLGIHPHYYALNDLPYNLPVANHHELHHHLFAIHPSSVPPLTSPTPQMSADFWAGYISGAVGILIGNPLDLIKVRLQASSSSPTLPPSLPPHPSSTTSPLLPTNPPSTPSTPPKPPYFPTLKSYITGTAAPILGYGALNALLFITYNRSEHLLNTHFPCSPSPLPTASTPPATGSNLYTTFLAGCIGGLATFIVSTPTELVKCRAQVLSTPRSSLSIARSVVRADGLRGLYFGGGVTAARDSVGYGFYFWSYELSRRWLSAPGWKMESGGMVDALLCGGLAGVVTWASIFPLDVVKTRVQTQKGVGKRLGAWEVGRRAFREEGWRVFFCGLGVCSVRAFVVNAVQWAVYEWIMGELGQGRGMAGKEKESGMGEKVVL